MDDLDDLLLLYFIDLSVLTYISNADSLDHIRRVGLIIYDKALADAKPLNSNLAANPEGLLACRSMEKRRENSGFTYSLS
jgi:hypothetical protein